MCMYTYIDLYIYIYICIHINIYIYVCVYIHLLSNESDTPIILYEEFYTHTVHKPSSLRLALAHLSTHSPPFAAVFARDSFMG